MSAIAQPVHVETFETPRALRAWDTALREMNLAARRPSPFQTLDSIAAHMRHEEADDVTPHLLMAFEGTRPIGLLPLRRRRESLSGRTAIVARAEDEERCATAFARHLFETDSQWTMLELCEQDAGSPLRQPDADPRRFYVRHAPSEASVTVDLASGFDAWFRSLNAFGPSLARRTRHLLGAGSVELFACEDPAAARPLLKLYLDLKARSWTAASDASRQAPKDPTWTLSGPALEHVPLFHWLLLDGVPIAGMSTLQFGGVAHLMELASDTAFADLSPTDVLFLLAVRDAIARGARAYDLHGHFAGRPQRWNAKVTSTYDVRVYRRGTLQHGRIIASDWRRRLFGDAPEDAAVDSSPSDETGVAPEMRDDRTHEGTLATMAFAALRRDGAVLDTLDTDALTAALPLAMKLARSSERTLPSVRSAR